MASEEEFEEVVKKSEKGLPEKSKVPIHQPLWSLSAQDPHRRVDPVGGWWRGRPCAESALSTTARASGWIEGSRKLTSCDPRSGYHAPFSGSPIRVFYCHK